MMKVDWEKYSKLYSESTLLDKLKKYGKKAGKKLVYLVLLLFHTLQKDNVPLKAKAIILGALGYFIAPFDFISDFIPAVGYTDDVGALMMALAAVSIYIDDEVKNKAKEKLERWFGSGDSSEIREIDSKL